MTEYDEQIRDLTKQFEELNLEKSEKERGLKTLLQKRTSQEGIATRPQIVDK